MKKLVVAALSILLVSCTASTPPEDPVQKFVPAGWKVIQSDTGDLDKDGVDDKVLVIEEDNPANMKPNDGMGLKVLNLNPRRLVVLLKRGADYQKVVEAVDFLPSAGSADSPCLSDPMDSSGEDSIQIVRGVIVVSLQDWYSCGDWSSTNYGFKFRYDNGRFRLIGYDYASHMRNSGDAVSYSTNFLTGRIVVTRENMFDPDIPVETTREKRPGNQKYYLDEMTSMCDAEKKGHDWCR